MRKAFIVIILALLVIWDVRGQKSDLFDFHFENLPFLELINHFDSLSDFSFSYSTTSIPTKTLVNIHLDNATVIGALDAALQYLPISYERLDDNIVLRYHNHTQTIRGIVRDADSRQPIPGTTVILVGSSPIIGDVTGPDGNFRIEQVPVGRVALAVSYVGYSNRTLNNLLLGSGKELVLEIDLLESITKMEEVVVHGVANSSETINEMALVSGRSFSTEETVRFPVSVGDPMRMASSFAGVMRTDDVNNEIIIRGNTPRGILWRLEGVEIPSPNHFSSEGASSGGISMLSTQVLSRSDFYTGAFAAQYGNALSGVFDLHFRKGNNEKQERTIQAGFLGLDASLEGPLLNQGGSYLFNYRYSTLSLLNEMGLIPIDAGENIFQDLAMNIVVPTKSMGTFSLYGLGGLSTYFDNQNERVDDSEDYNLGIVGLKNQLSIGSNTYVESSISWAGTLIDDTYDEVGWVNEDADLSKNYVRANALINHKFNARHTLEIGGQLSSLDFNFQSRFQWYDSTGSRSADTLVFFNDDDHTWVRQGYATWKFRLGERLTWINGAHLFNYEMNNETTFEPRSSIKWKPFGFHSFSLGYGMHSRMESLEYYLGNGLDENNQPIDHNTHLKVTKAEHFVLGYDWRINPGLLFRMETYYQRLFDIPLPRNSPALWFSTINTSEGYDSFPLDNSGTGRNYGVELTIDKQFDNGSYFLANTSLFESKYTPKDGIERNTRFAGNYVFNLIGGWEWSVSQQSNKDIFGMSYKVSSSGNQRYLGVNGPNSIAVGDLVYDTDRIFTNNLPAYFRMDLQFSFIKNRAKHTSTWRLDLQSFTGRRNVAYQDSFIRDGRLRVNRERQIGFLPILSYRLEF